MEQGDRWSRAEFVERYLRAAEVIVVERERMVGMLRSLFVHLTGGRGRILDLGCGDGFLAGELLKVGDVSAVLVDGSGEMLSRARERLSGFRDVRYIRAEFHELGRLRLPDFDFIVSSLALHHLEKGEKRELLARLRSLLRRGGVFVNIDLVRAPSAELQEWYTAQWRGWIEERRRELGVVEDYDDLVGRCLEAEHFSRINTLEEELMLLKAAGFEVVDCFYRWGMFAMYGGATER
ncbi:MAG: class I SAM-dependent methyltransferase [Euryarchaeota archaeon]|nr:class I SAM-dependent methyltransferase [Euryarchaeota archaeon]